MADVNEKVMKMVEDEVTKNPNVSTSIAIALGRWATW